MKILTLNTHSLQEHNYQEKLNCFVEGILNEKPDIIAMQEVNQTANTELMDLEMLEGQYPIPGCMPICRDNHAAVVANRLRQAGIECYWAWLPIKLGYDKYDEGAPQRVFDKVEKNKVGGRDRIKFLRKGSAFSRQCPSRP